MHRLKQSALCILCNKLEKYLIADEFHIILKYKIKIKNINKNYNIFLVYEQR